LAALHGDDPRSMMSTLDHIGAIARAFARLSSPRPPRPLA
jgi:hypothetical protein